MPALNSLFKTGFSYSLVRLHDMPITLSDLQDDDGLVCLQHVTLNPAQPREMYLKATGKQVFVAPVAFGIADLVVPRPDIAPVTRLRLLEKQEGLKRIQIFGVQFDKGLERAAEAKPGLLLKSMFKATLPDGLLNYDNCATLVTHIQRTTEYVQIEAWQVTGAEAETFYLHGILDPTLRSFSHLDGATMFHNKQAAETLFQQGTKVKGVNYQKWFRLDGAIAKADAVAIAKAYFPVEALLVEYVERHDPSAT